MVENSQLQEKAKIEITPLVQNVFENIDVLSNILTIYERAVLDVLIKHGALATKEVRRYYGFDMAEIVYKRKITDFSIDEFNEIVANLKRKKAKGVPAFETFDNTLQSLEKLGLVARRYDPLKKAKWLWIVNPNYLIALKKSKSVSK